MIVVVVMEVTVVMAVDAAVIRANFLRCVCFKFINTGIEFE